MRRVLVLLAVGVVMLLFRTELYNGLANLSARVPWMDQTFLWIVTSLLLTGIVAYPTILLTKAKEIKNRADGLHLKLLEMFIKMEYETGDHIDTQTRIKEIDITEAWKIANQLEKMSNRITLNIFKANKLLIVMNREIERYESVLENTKGKKKEKETKDIG